MSKKVLSVLLAVVTLISFCLFPSCSLKAEPIKYPYIFVHGLNGWGTGEGINDFLPYWGATTGSLTEYLNSKGHLTHEASVGPLSSSWDRACELYAQLTGTRVDYGEKHSAEHNHERYGRTYSKPVIENWGKKIKRNEVQKINLVGHSYGGTTIRLLTHLLENGAPEEVKQSKDVSPLFKGGNGNWVNSVTTLCAPNNGSSLYLVMSQYKLTDLVMKLTYAFAGITEATKITNGLLDFHLDHFGLNHEETTDSVADQFTKAMKKLDGAKNDNAAYDLSPEGAKALNDKIKQVEDVYYFSYAFSTTRKSSASNVQLPKPETLSVLKITSLLMGSFKYDKASDYKIDSTWFENDGLVNVVSAKYPFDEKWKEFDTSSIEKGVWNVMPVKEGDHGTVIGLNADTEKTRGFYDELFTMIEGLKKK